MKKKRNYHFEMNKNRDQRIEIFSFICLGVTIDDDDDDDLLW